MPPPDSQSDAVPAGGAQQRGGTSLTDSASRGIAWTAAVSVLERSLNLVTQFVLAALLATEVFGAWGVVQSVVLLVSDPATSGIREVLVYRSKRLLLWATPAFWCSAALGLGLSAVVLALAWPAAVVFGSTDDQSGILLGLLLVSLSPFLQAITTVPRAAMLVRHQFKRIALTSLAQITTQAAGTVTLAALGYGIEAFAIPFVAGQVVRAGLLLAMNPVRIGRRLRITRWRLLIGDSSRVWGDSFARWFRNQGDILIVSVFVDQSAAGVYVFARNVSRQVVSLFTQQVAGVLLPVLSELRGESSRMKAAFLRASRLLAYIGAPASIGIGACAWAFVPLAMDAEKWAGLPAVVSAMTVGIGLRVLSESAVSMQFAGGRFRQQMIFSLWTSVLFAGGLAAGAAVGGAFGAAIGFAAYCLVAGPVQVFVAIRHLGGRLAEVFRTAIVPVLLAVAAIAPLVPLGAAIPGEGRVHEAGVLVFTIVGGAVSYLVFSIVLRLPELRDLIERAEAVCPSRFRGVYRAAVSPVRALAGNPAAQDSALTAPPRPPV